MADDFDPYYEWLGIPGKDQPPHHYRLLGIELFEENLNVVERAADRQMAHVRSYQSGRHSKDSQRLLNELSSAKVCLLNAQRKAEYDQQLRGQLASRSSAEFGLPTDSPVPELPPGVPEALVTPQAAMEPATSPAAATFEIAIAPKDEVTIPSVRRGQSPGMNTKVLAGTTLVVAASCLLGYYFLWPSIAGSKGPTPLPSPAPVIAQQDPGGTESSNGGTANDPPASTPSAATTPGAAPNVQPTAGTDATVAVINESTTEISDPPIKPFTVDVSASLGESVNAAAGLVDARFALCQTLLWSRLDEANRAMRQEGYRLSRCRPYHALGEWRVAAIWLRDGLPSRIVGLTDSSTIHKADQSLSEQGFVPVDVVGVADGRREWFAAVWVKPKSSVGKAELTLGISDVEYPAPREKMRQQGLRSVVHNSYFDQTGKAKHCDLWIESPTAGEDSVWTGDQAQAQQQLATEALHTDAGVTLDPATGLIFTGSSWKGKKGVLKSFVGVTPEALQTGAAEPVSVGYLPTSLSVASNAGGELSSVSLWRPADRPNTPLDLVSLEPAPAPTTPMPSHVSMPAPAANELALRFDGQGSIELRDSVGLAKISSDFTVEAWLRFSEQAYGTTNILFGTAAYRGLHPDVSAMGMKGWLAGIKPVRPGTAAKSQFIFQWAESGGQAQAHTGDIPPFDDQWHHVALCNRGLADGWTLAVYVDGQEVVSASHRDSKDAPSPVGIYFGRPQYVAATRRSLQGSLRAFRASSGVRYSNSFQPETQWTSDDLTIALLDFSGDSVSEIADRSRHGRKGSIAGAAWVDLAGNPVRNSNPLAGTPVPPRVMEKRKVPANHEAQVAKLREVFKSEIAAAKDPQSWAALARTMLSQAAEEQDSDVHYALLVESRRLALDGLDWNLAARSIEELAAVFTVDAWGLRAETLNGLTKKVKVAADRKLLAETALTQADAALLFGAVEAAESMLSSASTFAPRGERELVKQINDARKRLADEKRGQQLVREARAKLAESPQDPAANEALGKYLCFTKDDWETGIKHLSLGPEGKLTTLAVSDEARPSDASQRLALAEAWSEFAKSATDAAGKAGATIRALHWYQLALPELTGVKKLQAEKQIEELSKAAPAAKGRAKFAWLEGEPGVALELRGHTSDITSMAIARSGRFLVSGSNDDTLRLWELANGKQSGQVAPGIGDISALLLSPDDRTVAIPAAVGGEYSIGIWSLQNGQPVGSVKADGPARLMAGSQDWRRVVYAKNQNGQGNLLIYNLTSLTPVAPFTCPDIAVQMAVSRTGRFLAAADSNNMIYVWDLQTGKLLAPFSGHSEQIVGLAFSPNERHLASGTNRAILVWDLAKGVEDYRIAPPAGLVFFALAFTPDGSRLLASGSTTELSVYNAQQGTLVAQVRAPNADGSNSPTRLLVCFPDGRAAALAGYDSLIRIWRLPH